MEALRCNCKRFEGKIGFDPVDCQIHGPGGLRDQQEAEAKRIQDEFKREHPIRHFIWQTEFKVRYRWLPKIEKKIKEILS
jgi:hypothetical protein